MEVVITSLDALIHKATNSTLDRPDPPALEAFCTVLSDSPNGAYIATRVIASRIKSQHPTEALLALEVLDACMKRCDGSFRSEVDKFRFLNEMIKLVSPKYYGNKTAPAVRQKVLNLMHGWTIEYPRELKIRDAYEMLKKQGVVKDIPPGQPPPPHEELPPSVPKPRNKEGILQDEERARMLQKLLQSKNPEDLQAANRLIKTMVREDERRVEAVSRRIAELQTVHNNARLLDEMLDQYKPGISSLEDLDLIKELHGACTRLRPTVFKLAAETQQNEEMLNDVLEASDELSQVFNKYTSIILQGKHSENPGTVSTDGTASSDAIPNGNQNSLLDLNTPSASSLLQTIGSSQNSETGGNSTLEVLGDIFSSVGMSNENSISDLTSIVPILKPVNVLSSQVKQENTPSTLAGAGNQVLNKGLADLDALGADLLKDSLSLSSATSNFGTQFTSRPAEKIPMNLIGKNTSQPSRDSPHVEVNRTNSTESQQSTNSCLLDLDFLISKTLSSTDGKGSSSAVSNSLHDDLMVDITCDDHLLQHKPQEEEPEISLLEYLNDLKTGGENTNVHTNSKSEPKTERFEQKEDSVKRESVSEVSKVETKLTPSKSGDVKPLTDINISLSSINPGNKTPMTVFEEDNGLTVVLHFAKNKPRTDVSVVVVSTTSRNLHPIEDYKFHAVVPKGCKVRLLPPSGDSFPSFSPFLPPAAVTQVMLIGKPDSVSQLFLKFVITYTCQEDSVSEMGEVNNLPLDDVI